MPTGVVLEPASDSGANNSDGITNRPSPSFDATVTEAGTISVQADGNPATIGSLTVSGPGTYAVHPIAPAYTSSTSYGGLPFNPTSVATADFNGDGNLDLMLTGVFTTDAMLLGTGSGTFLGELHHL